VPQIDFHPAPFQYLVLAGWSVATVLLVNWAGRNNRSFRVVVAAGVRLIILGVGTAAMSKAVATTAPGVTAFTDACVNFVLILAASIGANYVAHANMNLRDHPKGDNGPKLAPSSTVSDPVKPTTVKGRARAQRRR
jgi:hypothetical protein